MAEPRRRGPEPPAPGQAREVAPPNGGRLPAARLAALAALVALVSGAVSVAVTLGVLRLQSRANLADVGLGSSVRLDESSAVTDVSGRTAAAVVTLVTGGTVDEPRAASAYLVTSDGYLVTSAHAVAGAGQLTALVGEPPARHEARLVEADCGTDLAVLKVDGVSGLPTLAFGDSNALRLGQRVVAVGGRFLGRPSVASGVVTGLHGIVSAPDGADPSRRRELADVIQLDATLPATATGAPLLNVGGQVVGLTVALAPAAGQPAQNFAIASADVQPEVEAILRDRSLSLPTLGVTTHAVDAGEAVLRSSPVGAVVTAVAAASPADTAGLRVGDLITGIDEVTIGPARPLEQALDSRFRPQQRVTVSYWRGGQSLQAAVTLGAARPGC